MIAHLERLELDSELGRIEHIVLAYYHARVLKKNARITVLDVYKMLKQMRLSEKIPDTTSWDKVIYTIAPIFEYAEDRKAGMPTSSKETARETLFRLQCG